MEREKILFVYNPNAGTRKIQAQLSAVVGLLTTDDRELIISPTRKRDDAKNAVLEYLQETNCKQVVISGGDGTLHEVINGMMLLNEEQRVPLVYIPSGSTNDFGYSLNIPKDIKEAARLSVEGMLFPCDIGQFRDQYFVYTAAFGLFTDISYATPQGMKNVFGHAAYVINGAGALTRVKKFHLSVSCDGETIDGDFIYGMVVSSESIGGFRGITGPDVRLNDGVYEMFLIKDVKPLELPELVNDILKGHFDNKNIIYRRVNEVRFSSESQIAWTLDGEYGGDYKNVDIRVHKKAVTFMTVKNILNIVEGNLLMQDRGSN